MLLTGVLAIGLASSTSLADSPIRVSVNSKQTELQIAKPIQSKSRSETTDQRPAVLRWQNPDPSADQQEKSQQTSSIHNHVPARSRFASNPQNSPRMALIAQASATEAIDQQTGHVNNSVVFQNPNDIARATRANFSESQQSGPVSRSALVIDEEPIRFSLVVQASATETGEWSTATDDEQRHSQSTQSSTTTSQVEPLHSNLQINGPQVSIQAPSRASIQHPTQNTASENQLAEPIHFAREFASTAARQQTPGNVYSPERCREIKEDSAEVRTSVRENLISKISLDITPNRREKLHDPSENKSRTWHDRANEPLATGVFRDFKNGRVWIEDENGEVQKLPFSALSDEDHCFVAFIWGIPPEFTLDDAQYASRNWQGSSFAWKASEISHKPLYFEEPQLERYGHTLRPLAQSAVSGAHFFLNIAVLPYKSGIHPLHECQHPLGYYRPGSGAPWLVPPIPLSIRGGLAEAGAIVGGFFALP